MKYQSQWIESDDGLGEELTKEHDRLARLYGDVRLVTVLLLKRNPGATQCYRAVWQLS